MGAWSLRHFVAEGLTLSPSVSFCLSVLTLCWSEAVLLTCIISILQNIFNYFWKLYCSFCFDCRLFSSGCLCIFHFHRQTARHNYWLCRDWSREKAACWVWFLRWAVALWSRKQLLPYYTLQIRYNTQASKADSHVAWVYKPSKRLQILKATVFLLHSPSTRTPFIWVRCIFFSKERESATRIFLQPSLSKICWCKEHKIQWLLNGWTYQLHGKSPRGFCCRRECKECLRLSSYYKGGIPCYHQLNLNEKPPL